MGRITAEDIHKLIQSKLAPDVVERPKILNLIDLLSSMSATPPMPQLPAQEESPKQPTMPNVAGRQQLMDTNSIAAKHPFLGAR